MKNIVLITGGFDPLHSGHINYIQESKKLGDILVVGLNSDKWLIKKKGTYFMPFNERKIVLSQLKLVNDVIAFDDSNGHAFDAMLKVRKKYKTEKLIFANGGDRKIKNAPKEELSHNWIKYVWNVGGTKINSSSDILNNYIQRKKNGKL